MSVHDAHTAAKRTINRITRLVGNRTNAREVPKKKRRSRTASGWGELRGLEGDVTGVVVAVAVDAIQQDQAVGVDVDAGLRAAALVSSNVT